MITIKKLVKRYDDRLALDHLDLSIAKGVIFGLLGPNGAGKTTLIAILNGLTDFQEGEIEIMAMPLGKNLKKIRKRCAFIPQSPAFYDNLSVIENLRFFAGIQQISGSERRDNLDYAITINRLQPLLGKRAAILSGGQKKRLNIAVGLLNKPEIIYFDEPTAGIDPETRNDILSTIRSFKDENKTVVYTSHYMAEIEQICDEVAIINQGRIVRQGQLKSMLAEENVDSVVIELVGTSPIQLEKFARKQQKTVVLDQASLMIAERNPAAIGKILTELEAEKIMVKGLRYGTTNLESLFIRLTSRENNSDV